MEAGGILLAGVRKRYSRRGPWVLDEVVLRLEPSERLTVVGANGSGKSTLVGVIAGAVRPTRGLVRRPGQVAYLPDRLPARVRMSGREYVRRMGAIRGLATGTVARRSRDLFDRLAVHPDPDHPFEGLSKGNRQKVLLCQAFVAQADLLVLDEPWSGLDAPAVATVDALLHDARAGGATVVVTTHVGTDDLGTRRVGEAGRTVEIRGGALSEVPRVRQAEDRRRAVVCVELASSRPISEVPRWAGVIEGRLIPRSARVSLSVVRSAVDGVLRSALEDGWSVVEVLEVAADDRPSGAIADPSPADDEAPS